MFKNRTGGLEALFDRPKPSQWRLFLESPLSYLAKRLYSLQRLQPTKSHSEKAITIVCISDTHNSQPQVPPGHLLLFGGDLTHSGTKEEIQDTLNWIQSLSHPHKVVIAGNHDLALDSSEKDSLHWGDIEYLQDSSTQIQFSNGRKLKIFGSPWTPTPGTWAFKYSKERDAWTNVVPTDTDILVTHIPPKFHLDAGGLGDFNLLQELWRVRPRLHVFGHVHYGYGKDFLVYDRFERCYENVLQGSKGVLGLVWMFGSFLVAKWRGRVAVGGTQLVNAAIVGGLRDEKRRAPLTVVI